MPKKKETKVPPKKRAYKKRLQSTTPDPGEADAHSLINAAGVASLLQALHKHGYLRISEIQNLLKK